MSRDDTTTTTPPCCQFVPPHMLEAMAQSADPAVRAAAAGTLAEGGRLQGQREILGQLAPEEDEEESARRAVVHSRKTTYDCQERTLLPGRQVWDEGQRLTGNVEYDEATEGARLTYEVMEKCFGRRGIDGRGGRLISSTRYGRRFSNAYWQGSQMVYGLGDGYVFNRFTAALDIPAHELAHGVTQYTCGLQYYSQSGALNEHFSDVVGALVRQHTLNQTAEEADWLVGKGLFTNRVKARGLRDMLNPGTAYDDPATVGKDPQPAHMGDYYSGDRDNQGVHLNSGIPNRAFALACLAIGGLIWEGPAQVWYDAHTRGGVRPYCDFQTYAKIVIESARRRWGDRSVGVKAVRDGWQKVGVLQ